MSNLRLNSMHYVFPDSYIQSGHLQPTRSHIHDPRIPMITTSSLVRDVPHGLGPVAPHHMSYDPYHHQGKPTEFLPPLPKPAPQFPRYSRPPSAQSPRKEFHPPVSCPPTSVGPVNLAKDYFHPAFFANHYPTIYSYPHMLTSSPYLGQLPPIKSRYASSQPAAHGNPAFRPPNGYSTQPPPPVPPAPTAPPVEKLPAPAPISSPREKKQFKVPPGRETKAKPLAVQRKRPANHNNNSLPPNFTKGSLIQLANGDLKRVEDVTISDLEYSAESSPAFRLDPSTVVGIHEDRDGSGHVLLKLSHGENRRTVEIDTSVEHPYLIYGRGWASCSPQRTLTCFGLACQKLQVGDVCVSLSPRSSSPAASPPAGTTMKPQPVTDLEDRLNKQRRWSAPDQIDTEEEIIDPGSHSPPPTKRSKQ